MSTNISKQKREELLDKIKEIRTFISAAPQDENTGKLLSYLSDLEKDVNGKKYGLVFEEHREEIDEVLDTHTPVLTEEKDLFIDNGGQMNFLIEGDNLASLKLLEKTHKGKIDLVYIDPPYNTRKKDFIYDDVFVDKNDLFAHSKYISFMQKRLSIAKKLLSDEGFIFISIDDNEQAHLKVLCDEIFGQDNFVGMFAVENNPKGRKNSNFISISNDYCLAYAKNALVSFFVENIPKDIKDLAQDEEGNYVHNSGKRVLVGKNEFNENVVDFDSDKHYSVYYNKSINEIKIRKERFIEEIDADLLSKGYERFYSYNSNGFVLNTYTADKLLKLFDDGALDFKNCKIYEKNFSTTIRIKSIISSKKYTAVINNEPTEYIIDVKTTSAKTELKSIFNSKESPFSNPKNTGLLKLLITLKEGKNITILDFFAGSGTTGHAVMKLNAEDGGNRKFILCTNNENNICRDVTYERIKRVINKEGYAASLKYYKVEYVPISERLYYEYADELLKHIRELVELENGVNFTGNAEIAIVLTEEELDDYISQLENNTKCQKLYLGHDILMDAQQAQAIKDRKITVNIIPDYYYKELEG